MRRRSRREPSPPELLQRIKIIRARARKHGLTLRDYRTFCAALYRNGQSVELLPFLRQNRDERYGIIPTLGLDTIEAHLDWLDGDHAKAEDWIARTYAARMAQLQAARDAVAAARAKWLK